ncbi:hypothetical protein ACQPYH_12800 [Kribbella sp. CA-245084]|uniref:hypothetical protein n=1 Tax=Kribbella sp. CA-245084 TaxID=3239940 RepID=UPI003D91D2DD
MSDPTTPADPTPTEEAVTTADAGADTAELAAVPAGAENSAGADNTAGADKPAGAEKAAGAETAAGIEKAVGAEKAAGAVKTAGEAAGDTNVDGAGGQPKKKWWRRIKVRGPWVTVAAALVVLLALALLGYIWGLGPLNRLNTERGITPPAKLAGLDRITDKTIRDQAGLDQTREALSRINNGKQVTVEAYGSLDGDRLFVIIALRGKVDIDKTVADSGATPDKIKKIGNSTCVESSGNLPTQCYRGSNTLTVIAQSANEGVNVDKVEPVAEEAFKAMR